MKWKTPMLGAMLVTRFWRRLSQMLKLTIAHHLLSRNGKRFYDLWPQSFLPVLIRVVHVDQHSFSINMKATYQHLEENFDKNICYHEYTRIIDHPTFETLSSAQ